jgi:hypothetical protein
MSTIPVKEIERNRGETAELNHVSVPSVNGFRGGGEVCGSAVGKRHMRVKLCLRCPYTPRDLAGHYDPDGILPRRATARRRAAITTHARPRGDSNAQQSPTSL